MGEKALYCCICMFVVVFVTMASRSSFALSARSCFHDETAFRCVIYKYNYDGDTVTFDVPNISPFFGQDLKVRLYGVNTPEIKTSDVCEKELAVRAKEYVHTLLSKARYIELRNPVKGKYFRVVAEIWFDGYSLTQLLIKNRLGYQYFGESRGHFDWCKFLK